MLLFEKSHEFEAIDVFTEAGQSLLDRYSPLRRVPILIDQSKVICDSRKICEYLKADLSGENLLIVDEATDAGLILFQLKKMGLDPNWENQFSKLHFERIHRCLKFLHSSFKIEEWNLENQWLYCLLDWIEYRSVVSLQEYPRFHQFLTLHKERTEVVTTDPRSV